MKKDISFDTEMENGYKEKYKKRIFPAKKRKTKQKTKYKKHGSANIKQNRFKSKTGHKTQRRILYVNKRLKRAR